MLIRVLHPSYGSKNSAVIRLCVLSSPLFCSCFFYIIPPLSPFLLRDFLSSILVGFALFSPSSLLSRNSNPGSPTSRPFLPPPHDGTRALIFIEVRLQLFLPSSTLFFFFSRSPSLDVTQILLGEPLPTTVHAP